MSAPAPAFLSLPPLSYTYQSSQLWAPHHLRRVTIDEPHYHDYLKHTVQAHPPHLNALRRRAQHYGDNHFHLHRDIPVHQDYSLTPLHLSNLRPWDQLVDRPLSKNSKVLLKEVCLPFPTEHPYTSHISQFAVFPDTHILQPHLATTALSHTHKDVGTQTGTVPLRPITPYYVTQKASEVGVRKEQHTMFPPGHVIPWSDHVTYQSGCGRLWDLPHSKHHQRSQTYPAPMLQYTSSQTTPISPHTQEALSTIHSLTAGTTSYCYHFPPPTSHGVPNSATIRRNSTGGGQNVPRPVYSAYSHSRPYTAESRAKYTGKGTKEEEWEEEGWEMGEEEEGETDVVGETVVAKKDVATQTDPDDEYLPSTPPLQTDDAMPTGSKEGQMVTSCSNTSKPAIIVPRARLSDSASPSKPTRHGRHQRSFSVDEATFIPRSACSTRRFSELYDFSRSDVQKQFHSQYPEQAPDLRQYGTQKGKRHTIHGFNSYYFH